MRDPRPDPTTYVPSLLNYVHTINLRENVVSTHCCVVRMQAFRQSHQMRRLPVISQKPTLGGRSIESLTLLLRRIMRYILRNDLNHEAMIWPWLTRKKKSSAHLE